MTNTPAWHPADVYALIRKKGGNLTKIAHANGLERSTTRIALRRPVYAGEQAIADYLGIPAHVIWPDRYDEEGIPLHPRARKKILNGRTGEKTSQNTGAA